MSDAWYTSTDSVLLSRNWFEDAKGDRVSPPEEPSLVILSESDFYAENGMLKGKETPQNKDMTDQAREEAYNAYVAQRKETYANERKAYQQALQSLTEKSVVIGRYFTPIICPQDDIVSSEPQGRKFRIPSSLFPLCPSLSCLSDFEADETVSHTEGEVDTNNECPTMPFHYIYCVTAFQWLAWLDANKGATDLQKMEMMTNLLKENYEKLPEEERKEMETKKESALKLQRENNPLVDSFTHTQRFIILEDLADYLGSTDLYECAGMCGAKAVKGFTMKDFRILKNVKDQFSYARKLEILEELSWLNVKDVVIN
ncbi:hypothetical protein GMAR_ORF239 [Golden Marseillevirus]|uniref:hypothetical protein n=1 Tax=Golden Marseillevirus TaxID=1720526 RepID=UPI000877A95C|nr:hypothetical protein GMAR_ORF239 [Golden Marseillevirus]ALX27613.1 hypothetical protein GMAR_ORF239 [Golden Marseillevirus]